MVPSHYLNQCWNIVNWTLGKSFSEILTKIHIFSFKNMHLKMLSGNWQTFCLSLNVITITSLIQYVQLGQLQDSLAYNISVGKTLLWAHKRHPFISLSGELWGVNCIYIFFLENCFVVLVISCILTHLPLVPHICVSESGEHWLR